MCWRAESLCKGSLGNGLLCALLCCALLCNGCAVSHVPAISTNCFCSVFLVFCLNCLLVTCIFSLSFSHSLTPLRYLQHNSPGRRGRAERERDSHHQHGGYGVSYEADGKFPEKRSAGRNTSSGGITRAQEALEKHQVCDCCLITSVQSV